MIPLTSQTLYRRYDSKWLALYMNDVIGTPFQTEALGKSLFTGLTFFVRKVRNYCLICLNMFELKKVIV